jgi:hypothetical protein
MSENTRSAAEAFDALRAEVGATREDLRKLAKAIDKPAPDYSLTLGDMAKRVGAIETTLAYWDKRIPVELPGERYLPHELKAITKEAKGAAQELREATSHTIKQQSVRWWMAGTFGLGTVIGIMLFIGIAHLLPRSAGAWMEAAIFGSDPWMAGATLMSQADPVNFERMVALYQACPQDDSVEQCQAAMAGKPAPAAGQ